MAHTRHRELVISDFRVIGDQEDLFGRAASVPTVADAE
jgi:hypothetical protein